jgi:hypothetical protein
MILDDQDKGNGELHPPLTDPKELKNVRMTRAERRENPRTTWVHDKFRNFVMIDSLSNSRSFADLLGKFGTSRGISIPNDLMALAGGSFQACPVKHCDFFSHRCRLRGGPAESST